MIWFKKHQKVNESNRSNIDCLRFGNKTKRSRYLWIEVWCIGVEVPSGAVAEVQFVRPNKNLQNTVDYTDEGWTFWCEGDVVQVLLNGEKIHP